MREGRIGELRAFQFFFSYDNRDPENIRNMADIGGGGLYDIGCYPIVTARFIFTDEPRRVVALVEHDPVLRIDRLASAILDFPGGHASFLCSTQLVPFQRVHIAGTAGRIEIEIPVNAPPDQPCRIFLDDGKVPGGRGARTIELEVCDQYTLQGDLFALWLRTGQAPEFPLEDAVKNMRVIDALFRSARTGGWVEIGS